MNKSFIKTRTEVKLGCFSNNNVKKKKKKKKKKNSYTFRSVKLQRYNLLVIAIYINMHNFIFLFYSWKILY